MRAVWNNVSSFLPSPKPPNLKNLHILSIISDTNLAHLNPLRYRGYVYDNETGLYYLQSRYYDPITCRFVNADGYVSTGAGLNGFNMFAYCNNNPVMCFDSSGDRPIFASSVAEETDEQRMISFAIMNNRPLPTSETGSAEDYDKMVDEYEQNCYSYAVQEKGILQPGELSGLYPIGYDNVYSVGVSIVADMKSSGYSVREIDGPNSKVYDNEFKIALRVGTEPYDIYNNHDYHFMIQTGTGQWAEKHGRYGPSELHNIGLTPDNIPWVLWGPYYDSEILYYAIAK